MSPALAVENIEVVYNHSIQALRGLSLEVPQGRIVALLGSNGAGKTTTLKSISGILPFERGRLAGGRISVFGEAVGDTPAFELARKGLAHVREGRHIFGDLTVEENLVAAQSALAGRGQASVLRDKVFAYFPRLQERRRQVAGYLSGGEQQMLAIGRAMMGQPRLMLMDEPSLGLAPLVVRDIFDIIRRINQEDGVAILLVEQNARIALSVADSGYILENGRIVIDGPADQLMANPDVQRFYLGSGEEDGHISFRDVKHYKRRKRWLS